jgi:thioredoxin-like negative regulator of GroEL
MKQTTWADERVAAAIERYLPVKIDIDEQADVARQFGVTSVPRVEVLGVNGERTLVTEGAVTAEQFLSLLQQPSPLR